MVHRGKLERLRRSLRRGRHRAPLPRELVRVPLLGVRACTCCVCMEEEAFEGLRAFIPVDSDGVACLDAHVRPRGEAPDPGKRLCTNAPNGCFK